VKPWGNQSNVANNLNCYFELQNVGAFISNNQLSFLSFYRNNVVGYTRVSVWILVSAWLSGSNVVACRVNIVYCMDK